MEDLLKGMTHPVDSMRLTARQAVDHHAFKEEPLCAPPFLLYPSFCDLSDREFRLAFIFYAVRSNLPRRTPRSTRRLTPVSPPRTSLSRIHPDSDSSASTNAGLRDKKTASPPKKVVRTVVRTYTNAGNASGQKKGEDDFLWYNKSSARLVEGGEKEEVSGGREMGGVRVSPSKERLTATKAVTVKSCYLFHTHRSKSNHALTSV